MTRSNIRIGIAAGMLLILVAGCAALAISLNRPAGSNPTAATNPPNTVGATSRAENRRAFFGQLHIHTQSSYDAWAMGTKLTPAQAYAYASGETVMVPAAQVQLQLGLSRDSPVPARRAWALDFMAVTDHAENIGVMASLESPDSAFGRTPLGQRLIKSPAYAQFARVAAELGVDPPLPAEWNNPQVVLDAWEVEKKAARDYYKPGVFTTFVAFEWTAMPGRKNLHRNVIFEGADAPPPFGANQSTKPEDLWTYLESIRVRGEDVIAIPHNGNASGGLMYDWNGSDGRPIDEAYAQRRAINEPLSEIIQIKGQSETHPLLSPNDEFADFEIYDHLLPSLSTKSDPNGSYIRQAYGRGLVIQSRIGANPFKFGLVGGSDIHNGLESSDENATVGGDTGGIDPRSMMPVGEVAKGMIGLVTPPTYWDLITGTPLATALNVKPAQDKTAEELLAEKRSVVEMGSGGLTGVWAQENTRSALFAALKRKETFATSGTRIRVRMFGGWNFTEATLRRSNWVGLAYAQGVAMGGDLPARSRDAIAPVFILEAIKDPDGANLDRIQVVKVWMDGEGYREKVFNALEAGSTRNRTGAAILSTVWKDTEFDPTKPAVYYARVLEVATPRWSTLLAKRNGLPMSTLVPEMIQERAWSSPIWFTPSLRSTSLQPTSRP
jgi:hypothetical protein